MSCLSGLPGFILAAMLAMPLDAAEPVGRPFSPALPNVTITALTTDALGNTYVTGTISSPGLPTTPKASQPSYHATVCPAISPQSGPYPCRDSFVVRYDASGQLVYATYLGGNGNDDASGIAVDAEGNAYVTGYTGSTDFPTTSNVLANGGGPSGFVAKLNPAGASLLYATYIPVTTQSPTAIAVDGAKSVYIAGSTADPGFPTTPGAFQNKLAGGSRDGFVLKLNSTADAILYATYLGGSGTDNITALSLDSFGNAYVTGSTDSPDFPVTPGAVDTMPAAKTFGSSFVAKLNSDGSALLYSARPTGSYTDQATAIAVDPAGRAYVTGGTNSPDFPSTRGALQTAHGNMITAFVVALSADGKSLAYSTFLGGATAGSNGAAVKVNQAGEAYVAGWTLDFDFPSTPAAPERCNPLGSSATQTASWVHQGFLSKLAGDGSALLFSSYVDGAVAAMAIGAGGEAVLAGNTYNAQAATVTASVRGISPVPAPSFGVDCVSSSATGMSGIVAPGELVTIYGSGLGPAQGASAEFVNGKVGTELGGTGVLFDGIPAPVLYTQADRVQAVVPFELAGKTSAGVQVQYGGQATSAEQVAVQNSVPGIFHLGSTNQAAVLNEDGTLNSPTNPATRGSVVSLFATGAGPMDPLPTDGAVGAAPLPGISAPVTVEFDGWRGEVSYAGAAPGFVAGTVQVNARIPVNMLSSGPYTDLNLIVDGQGAFFGKFTIAIR